MDRELTVLGDFTVALVPTCEMVDLMEDHETAESVFLTDMVDEFLHYGVCDVPEATAFARRLGVMV